ncbi:glycosyl transferase family 1 [Duganella sp. Leaf126]|uniref:glycosyltransferase family 4 protein n=1 Tax=Duganella sp. Leaf126 TaxID=1736266 RepID=UPI0006FB3C9A|nr:glycosyltransferase family 4 protein [Duganella sp. Leaf126]KQQ47765.1 glycosyl transferase family 1 [Duganella sp. Leaf126]
MRVLHFYKTYYPDSWGGVEQAIRQLCVGTGRLGVENTVLTLGRGGASRIDVEGHVVHRARQNIEIASTGFSLGAIGKLAALARQADIVHYHFPWPFMDLAHFLARVDKPTVVSYHADIVRQKRLLRLYAPLQHCFLGRVDAIVAASPNYLASSPVLRRFAGKTRVIGYGLDRAGYRTPPAAAVARWRARCGTPAGDPLPGRFFLFLGVLRYYKGLHVLLDALAHLATPVTGAAGRYPVVIAGAGPLEQALRQHAARLGLDHVHFVGAVDEDDKSALLQACYAMVFPSHLRAEAFGISLLEAAMFGKPLISCEIGTGTTYVNLDGQTGLAVPPDDPIALAAAMRALWDDPQRVAAMGRQAAVRYGALFTAERMARDYHALYRQLQQRPGAV